MTPQEKADLVYQARQTIERRFAKLENIPDIIDCLPKKTLYKLNLNKKLLLLVKIILKILKNAEPVPLARERRSGKLEVIHRFKVDVGEVLESNPKGSPEPYHIIKEAVMTEVLHRPATEDEIEVHRAIRELIDALSSHIDVEPDPKIYTKQEFYEGKVLELNEEAKVKGFNPYEIHWEKIEDRKPKDAMFDESPK